MGTLATDCGEKIRKRKRIYRKKEKEKKLKGRNRV